ncbi:alpha/beta fold hydrolase [Marinibaculum pumilum]|uniref:Alpha/beta fold hydrolase n=1 Tax=Marinibaculum pumilum TaxID=1766165 RepID=A0ABV7KVC9_9PROT
MATFHAGGMQVERDGAAGGVPVVMIHGLGGTSNSFTPQMNVFARGFRCYRPDLPGSGRSPLPKDGRLSIDGFVAAVLALADAEGLERFHLLGHSLGTIVCQHLAVRAPGRVASMALIGALPAPPEAARAGLRTRATEARADGMAGIADAVCAGSTSAASKADQPVAIAAVRESLMRQPAEGYAATCEALADARPAALDGITARCLLIAGAEDPVAPPAVGQALADGLHEARLVVLPRCGHWPNFERAAEVNRELRHFHRVH